MKTNVKTTILRAPSAVSQAGAARRLESADGTRWAISRNAKLPLGDGRFDVVEVWTLRHRIDGRAAVRSTGVDEKTARAWVE